MTTEEIKLLSDLVDDGNSMILWWNSDTKIAYRVIGIETQQNGQVMASLADSQSASLDAVELSEFLMANRIDPADFS